MSNRHWTDEEMEEAFEYWAWESEDSIAQTSVYLDIPERTLRNWHKRDDWHKRKKARQAELAEPAVGEAKVELKLGLSKVVTQLLADAANPKLEARDRLESQKLILAMTLGQQFDTKNGNTFISLTEAKHIHLQAEQSQAQSIEDLRRQATMALEANVSSVERRGTKANGPVRVG